MTNKTAFEALRDHSKTFWDQRTLADCDRFQAIDAQLRAFNLIQNGANIASVAVEEHYAYARQIMGVTEGDQFYA